MVLVQAGQLLQSKNDTTVLMDDPTFWVFWDTPLYTGTQGLRDSGIDNLVALLFFRYLEFSPSSLTEGRESVQIAMQVFIDHDIH